MEVKAGVEEREVEGGGGGKERPAGVQVGYKDIGLV